MAMKQCGLLPIAVGLLLLAGCGSAASEVRQDVLPNGPALVAMDGETKAKEPLPQRSDAPKDQNPDLKTMSLEEEASYTLFCNVMNESGFREMICRDGVDFLPDHMAHIQGSPIAYFKDRGEVVVICDEGLSWFQHVPAGSFGSGTVRNALWLDADRLLVLMDADTVQQVCLYSPTTQQIDVVYASPEGQSIRDITVDEKGEVDCLLIPEPAQATEELQLPVEPSEETGEEASAPPEDVSETAEAPQLEEEQELQPGKRVALILPKSAQ